MGKGKRMWSGVGACVFALALVGSVAAADSGPIEKELFRKGARLWPQYCGQCHNARPGSEFNRLEWDTLMLHMRVAANLPAQDAEAIRVYLRAH